MDSSAELRPSLRQRLAAGPPLISDGATWTYLRRHGLASWECPELFNVTHPEVVQTMARDYFTAGADVILTNSFGGNRFLLGKYGYGDRVQELNMLAVQHARGQAAAAHYVIGSVGPTGELLRPLGRIRDTDMRDAFTEQVTALEAGGADGVVIETMRLVEEAVLAIQAAKTHTQLLVIATMVFEKRLDGFVTMTGSSPQEVMRELQAAGADVVGANCGTGIDDMVELGRQIREATDGYTLIHSNAGIPSIKDADIVYPESPDYMAPRFKALADMGITIIGGCCGTGPAHIRALAHALRG
jgi:5-methyltetrahydrofolate--homocysteine methyltransferase